jgi:hypothetical protein
MWAIAAMFMTNSNYTDADTPEAIAAAKRHGIKIPMLRE